VEAVIPEQCVRRVRQLDLHSARSKLAAESGDEFIEDLMHRCRVQRCEDNQPLDAIEQLRSDCALNSLRDSADVVYFGTDGIAVDGFLAPEAERPWLHRRLAA